jgi:hypothetical protein
MVALLLILAALELFDNVQVLAVSALERPPFYCYRHDGDAVGEVRAVSGILSLLFEVHLSIFSLCWCTRLTLEKLGWFVGLHQMGLQRVQ